MTEQQNQKAWVVFSGQTDLLWLKMLRPGFRHCLVLLQEGNSWISVDPMSNYTDVSIHHAPREFDLPQWLRNRGLKVVETNIVHRNKAAPFMLFTCVEAVKRMIGLHNRFIMTPWQLYRHLEKQKSPQPQPRKNAVSMFQGVLSWEA